MEDQVDEEEKNRRVHELIDLSETMQLNYAKQFVGEVLEVIPERAHKGSDQKDSLIMGYSDNYMQLVFEGTEAMIGQVCKVKVVEAGVNESKGQLVRLLESTQAVQVS
jgi:threonylcarbamoyladenosine tRNA methylthiotransferase MtaB